MATAAGYKGEPVRMIVASSMVEQYNQAVVVQSQLQAAGFTVDLQVYDLATFFTVRNNSADPQWDLAFSFYSTTPDPSLVLMLSPTYAGWWDTPEIRALRGELNRLVRFEDRYEQWGKIMDLWYEQVPALKFGDAFQLHLMRSEVKGGYGTTYPDMTSPYFWNAWYEP
jgi:peptide/nickel transport system substrate-binding protein